MKYIQFTIVMGLFFALVLFKNFYKGDVEENVQVGNQNQIQQISITPSSQNSSNSMMNNNQNMMSKYKDGSYIGTSEDAFYGYIKVKIIISGGKIVDVIFLDHPKDNRTSDYINSQAMPLLKAEAISAQNANVDKISGASDSSMAFQKSLAKALAQAN